MGDYKEKAKLISRSEITIKDILRMELFMGMERWFISTLKALISMKKKEFTKDSGNMVRDMVRVKLNGMMDQPLKAFGFKMKDNKENLSLKSSKRFMRVLSKTIFFTGKVK